MQPLGPRLGLLARHLAHDIGPAEVALLLGLAQGLLEGVVGRLGHGVGIALLVGVAAEELGGRSLHAAAITRRAGPVPDLPRLLPAPDGHADAPLGPPHDLGRRQLGSACPAAAQAAVGERGGPRRVRRLGVVGPQPCAQEGEQMAQRAHRARRPGVPRSRRAFAVGSPWPAIVVSSSVSRDDRGQRLRTVDPE